MTSSPRHYQYYLVMGPDFYGSVEFYQKTSVKSSWFVLESLHLLEAFKQVLRLTADQLISLSSVPECLAALHHEVPHGVPNDEGLHISAATSDRSTGLTGGALTGPIHCPHSAINKTL